MSYGVLIVTGGMTHQENYARGFQADPRCRIIGVTDEAGVDGRRARLNQSLAAELKVPYFEDLSQALARPGVDVVSITTEHDRQGRVTLRCAEAGKHLYMDKPLAGSLAEARAIESVVKRKNLRTQMFSQVPMPSSRRLRRIVANGQIGELRAFHQDLFFAKGYADASIPLARRREQAVPDLFLVPDAKREMFNIAVYSLALVRWLSGGRAFVSVRALTGNYFLGTNARRNMEDFGALSLTMEGGLAATISAGRTGWRSHGSAGHNRVKLIGTKGSVFLDAYQGHGEVCTDRQPQWQSPPANPEDPMAFWASSDQRKSGGPIWFTPPQPAPSDQTVFIDSLERNRPADVTAADGVRVLEALFAAYRSAAEHRTVKISEV
ncbi:MAG: Gfo/Idh/MocA family oxidoreductase [Acidobacteria bacterium]|nr:Gfo/Idh/MocA family oxidoreductase [Acidobacteriota bacterium]